MKVFKLGLVVMAAALISLVLGAPAMAFHDDGVARCAGCHTMHNSQDGVAMTDTPGGHLLKMSDPNGLFWLNALGIYLVCEFHRQVLQDPIVKPHVSFNLRNDIR